MIKRLPDSTTQRDAELAAESLQRSHARHDDEGLARLAKYAFPGKTVDELTEIELSLPSARLAIAREYGFLCWRHLETFLIARSGGVGKEQPRDFTQIACLNYLRGWDTDLDQARNMYANDAEIATKDIYHACCVGDVGIVKTLLKHDPELLNRPGGYFAWEPLMYACYSRLNLAGQSTLNVARYLLERGANPNAHFMWGGQCRFTALTGVFAEGEAGPTRYPEHESCEALATALLESGADPNDGQALYNRMFTPGNACLKLLIEFGITPEARCNWLLTEGDRLVPNPKQTLRYQLDYAIKSGFPDRAKLCVDHGADLQTAPNERTLYESAMLAGEASLADYLVTHGAEKVELAPRSRFVAACMNADEELAANLLSEDPHLLEKSRTGTANFVHAAAESKGYDAIRLVAKLGGDLHQTGSPLIDAVCVGDLKMIKLLIELGADPQVRDAVHHATPIQWAHHRGHSDEIIEYLSECNIDMFDAILSNNLTALSALLDADPSLLEKTLGELRDAPNNPGENDWHSPLVSAVMRDNAQAVELLLERGAKTTLRDRDGKTLLDLAKKHASDPVIALLQ